MTKQEKVEKVAEIFEVEPDSISDVTALDSLHWDSMSMLSVIALVNEHFGKRISGAQIKGFRTVGDILAVME